MKKFALAVAVAAFATSASAGGLDDPIVEPDVIETTTGSGDHGWLVPLFLVLLIAGTS